MRKYINKILKRFGYVPIDDVKHYKDIETAVFSNDCKARYFHGKIQNSDAYRSVVYLAVRGYYPNFCIKSFESTDRDYVKLCAEELCEMLNQRY